jgi:hypothetical protein
MDHSQMARTPLRSPEWSDLGDDILDRETDGLAAASSPKGGSHNQHSN